MKTKESHTIQFTKDEMELLHRDGRLEKDGHTYEYGTDLDEAKERDYKAEYKKFQSSDKSKKYRAELNAYNRKKGTYGNGDGKDASHKGGKIAGFEKESVNRGRAEKSRLKKEEKLTERNEEHFKKSVEMIYHDIDRLVKTFNTTDYKKNKKAKKFIYTAQQLKLKLHMALSGITHNVREGKLTEIKTIPSGEIQRRMRKSKYWKKVGLSFEREVGKKFRGKKVSEKALDKMLPDYIDGKEIHALFIGAWVEGKGK